MRLTAVLLALGLLVGMIHPGHAQSQLTTVESKYSVKETADRLAKAVEGKGLKVIARVDHAAGAKSAGLEMPAAEVVMFGNPKLGTPLMLANPEIGIDLPMKMLIWQGADGTVRVGYAEPGDLMARYAIAGKEDLFKTMTGALAAFAEAATGAE